MQMELYHIAAFFLLMLVLAFPPTNPMFMDPAFKIVSGLVIIGAVLLDPISGLLLGLTFAVLLGSQYKLIATMIPTASPSLPETIHHSAPAPMDPIVVADDNQESTFLSEYWLQKAQSA